MTPHPRLSDLLFTTLEYLDDEKFKNSSKVCEFISDHPGFDPRGLKDEEYLSKAEAILKEALTKVEN